MVGCCVGGLGEGWVGVTSFTPPWEAHLLSPPLRLLARWGKSGSAGGSKINRLMKEKKRRARSGGGGAAVGKVDKRGGTKRRAQGQGKWKAGKLGQC